MLSHSKKYCKNGCNRFVFAHNLCIYCYRKEILLPKQKLKPKKIYKIAPYSEKRIKLNAEYERIKQANNERLKAEGKFKCFFTNDPFPKNYDPDYHHTIGRDGSLLTDMAYAFPCYFQPHREYHDLQYDYVSLNKIQWYDQWLERIKIDLPIVYAKEIYKINKANDKKANKKS